MSETLHHETINLQGFYAAPVERVFCEFADPAARAKWSAPANDTLVYDKADFREGGGDVFRCGPPHDLRFRGETAYQVIVPNKCVIFTEILTEGGKRLAVALNTLTFEATGEGTMLKVTVQIASFVGPGMVEGYESGNKGALEGLSRHLATNS
jgi:uncharacterized protein YndB with AHSA1/START domain